MSKLLEKEFTDQYQNVSEDEAAALVVKSEQVIRDLKKEMKEDEKLQAAMQLVKDIKGGYSDVKKREDAKIKFFLSKIDEIVENAPSSKN